MLAAGAVASLIGGAALAESGQPKGEGKACYRTQCGKSVKGHEGQCGGTKVEGIGDQKACETAGGAWTTEADAAKFKKNEG
jgi:hypothetical protein